MISNYLDKIVEVFNGVESKKTKEEAMDCYMLLRQIHLQSVKGIINPSEEVKIVNYDYNNQRNKNVENNIKKNENVKLSELNSRAKIVGVDVRGLTEDLAEDAIKRAIYKRMLQTFVASYGIPILVALVLIGAVVALVAYAISKIKDVVSEGGSGEGVQQDEGVTTANSWIEAVGAKGYKITGRFGETRPGHLHGGVDIAMPIGTAVTAPFSGTVTLVKTQPGGAGNYIQVTSKSGTYRVTFMHLSSTLVRQGQQVQAGQVVARSGNTGNSTGPHLHFELDRLSEGKAQKVNPLSEAYHFQQDFDLTVKAEVGSSTQRQRANFAYETFKRNGFTDNQAAALTGLIYQETRFSDSAIKGLGVAQWTNTGNRRSKIIAAYNRINHKHVSSIGEIPYEDQVLMMIYELKTKYAKIIPILNRDESLPQKLQEDLFLGYSNGKGDGNLTTYQVVNKVPAYQKQYRKYGTDFARSAEREYWEGQLVIRSWRNNSNVK